jgi:hypothetical protein
MSMKIVILEDNADRAAAMRTCLVDRFHQYEIRVFAKAKDMIRFLETTLPDSLVLSLDHDLVPDIDERQAWKDPGTGRDVAEFLASRQPVCPVVIATTNSPAADGMERVLHEAHWQTYRVIPFDDLAWIAKDWFKAMRQAILSMARRDTETSGRTTSH